MPKNTPKQALRCALYTRVSTEQQVDQGESLDTQKTQLAAYAQLNDWKVVKTYQDAGISAKNTDRPAFQAMMKDARQGLFDVVLVTKVDRISRNLVDLCQLVEELQEHGIAFVSASQQFDTTAALGKLVLGILGSFAQFERDMIAERVKENMLERAKKGKWNGGPPPFGYCAKEKELQIDEQEAAVVREIFDTYQETVSILGTTRAMNEKGLKTRKGVNWWNSSIERLLVNPIYMGALQYNKRDASGKIAKVNPNKDFILARDAVPAIVTEEQFSKVQKQIRKTKAVPTRSRSGRVNLFSGLLKCEHCGQNLYLGTTRKKNKSGTKVYKYYKCRTRLRLGPDACPGTSIKEEEIQEAVIKQLERMSLDDEAMATMETELSSRTKGDLEKLNAQLIRVKSKVHSFRGKKDRLFSLFTDEAISRDDFLEQKARLEQEYAQDQEQLQNLEQETTDLEAATPQLDLFKTNLQTMQDVFDSLDFPDQKRLIQNMVTKVVVGPEIRLTLAIPTMVVSDWQEYARAGSPATGRSRAPATRARCCATRTA